MATLLLALCLVLAAPSPAPAQQDPLTPADVVRFLEGTWINTDVVTRPGAPPHVRTYFERMSARDDSTLVITAFAIGDAGADITRDVTFAARGDSIAMVQGDFEARGTVRGNMLSLTGSAGTTTYTFRLYLLEDHYVFQVDLIAGGRVVQSHMSWLYRVPGARLPQGEPGTT